MHPHKLTMALMEAVVERGTQISRGTVEGIEWKDVGTTNRTAKGDVSVM